MANHIYIFQCTSSDLAQPPIQALLSTLEKASRWAEALDLLGARELRGDVISYSAVISALEAWRVKPRVGLVLKVGRGELFNGSNMV